jgi:anti-sigma factor RsiW
MNDDTIDAATEARMIRIMRYRDGQLSPQEAEAVAAEIAADPAAAELAEAFAVGDTAARAAWAELESGPVPLALARRVTEAARQRPVARPMLSGWRAAAAVVVALGVGVAAAILMQHDRGGLHLAGVDDGTADPGWKPALVSALGQEPALTQVGFKDGKATVAITRWFSTGTAMRCAEYAISDGAVTGGGIACRRHDGGWDVIEQDQ